MPSTSFKWYRTKFNIEQRGREGYVEVCLQGVDEEDAKKVAKAVFLPKGARFLNFDSLKEIKHANVRKWQEKHDANPQFPDSEANTKIDAIDRYNSGDRGNYRQPNSQRPVNVIHRPSKRPSTLTMHNPDVVREQSRQRMPPVHSEALSIPQTSHLNKDRSGRELNRNHKARASTSRKKGGKEDRRFSDGGRKKKGKSYNRSKSKRSWDY